jgi:NitT/TauT family transport system permease protein
MLQRIVWWGLILLAVVLVVSCSPMLTGFIEAIRFNPLFQLVKTQDSPPYSIGVVDSAVRSLLRVLAGTALGFTVGLVLGVGLSQLQYLGPRLYLVVLCLAPLAPVVWLPILLRLLGIGDLTAVVIVASGSVFVTALIVYYLATHPRKSYVDILRTMRATRSQVLRFVIMPSMLPMLLLLLRLNLFTGWIALLAAEMSGAETGLGAMLILGRSLNNWNIIILAIFLIACLAFALDRTVSGLATQLVARRYGGWLFVD